MKQDPLPHLFSRDGTTAGVNDELVLHIVVPHDERYDGTLYALYGHRGAEHVGVDRVPIAGHRTGQLTVIHPVHGVGVTRVRAAEGPVYYDHDSSTEIRTQVGLHLMGSVDIRATSGLRLNVL